uniref:Uncharacterized protein n=1 Tax=Oryza punctata TaxID=4537 RepID=A0A0E0MGD5_ORYPU
MVDHRTYQASVVIPKLPAVAEPFCACEIGHCSPPAIHTTPVQVAGTSTEKNQNSRRGNGQTTDDLT